MNKQPDDHPWPHPDFLQVVFVGRAWERDGGRDAAWSDTEGYEASSQTMAIDDAIDMVGLDPLSVHFLRLLSAP